MKKLLKTITISAVAFTALVACGDSNKNQNNQSNAQPHETFKVGMMIDSGTIDDKSFNQGTWEGIKRYESEHEGVSAQYVQPAGEAKEDYLNAADNLMMAGNQIIVAPGFKFEEAISELAVANPDVKFVILDGQPENMQDNTVAIYFTEQEAGFLAGVAAALQSKTGKVGFIGGMQIPSVEKFGWGYVAGVAYANKTYGTNVEVLDYLYNGTFYDVQGGQAQAGGMYDKGIDIIFSAAAAVGNGVINEAKARTESGEEVYVIGVDVDQYEEGLMNDGKSVILTSAIKRIDNAAYDALDDYANGEFPGGQVITMDAKSNGVGLPTENPNLSTNTVSKIEEVLTLIKEGTIVVPTSADALEAMLTELEQSFSSINFR